MNHFELLRTKRFFFKEPCSNELPQDYGCRLTCDDWMAKAGESICDETWSQGTNKFDCSYSQELIKDYCKAACWNCGRYQRVCHFRIYLSFQNKITLAKCKYFKVIFYTIFVYS